MRYMKSRVRWPGWSTSFLNLDKSLTSLCLKFLIVKVEIMVGSLGFCNSQFINTLKEFTTQPSHKITTIDYDGINTLEQNEGFPHCIAYIKLTSSSRKDWEERRRTSSEATALRHINAMLFQQAHQVLKKKMNHLDMALQTAFCQPKWRLEAAFI